MPFSYPTEAATFVVIVTLVMVHHLIRIIGLIYYFQFIMCSVRLYTTWNLTATLYSPVACYKGFALKFWLQEFWCLPWCAHTAYPFLLEYRLNNGLHVVLSDRSGKMAALWLAIEAAFTMAGGKADEEIVGFKGIPWLHLCSLQRHILHRKVRWRKWKYV